MNQRAAAKATKFWSTPVEPKTKMLSKILSKVRTEKLKAYNIN